MRAETNAREERALAWLRVGQRWRDPEDGSFVTVCGIDPGTMYPVQFQWDGQRNFARNSAVGFLANFQPPSLLEFLESTRATPSPETGAPTPADRLCSYCEALRDTGHDSGKCACPHPDDVPRMTLHDTLVAFETIRSMTRVGEAAHGIATLAVQQIKAYGGDGVPVPAATREAGWELNGDMEESQRMAEERMMFRPRCLAPLGDDDTIGPREPGYCDVSEAGEGGRCIGLCAVALATPSPETGTAAVTTAPSCGHAAYRNGENCINDGCYNAAYQAPAPAPEPVKPPATCQCFHAPEQHHRETGCGVVTIMSGRCPCEWNGARTPAAGTAPKGRCSGCGGLSVLNPCAACARGARP